MSFFVRRLFWAIPVLFFVSLTSFFLMHQAPGGPFDKDNNKKQVDGATLKALNARFGLDKPESIQLMVFNAQGTMVQSKNLGDLTSGEHTVSLEANSLPSGSYRVMLQGKDGVANAQWVVIK